VSEKCLIIDMETGRFHLLEAVLFCRHLMFMAAHVFTIGKDEKQHFVISPADFRLNVISKM
jgi:hypothetical protein